LWNGLFSIRTTVGIAGRNLNGRFLVDSSAQTSQISPEWLEAQGIQPALIYASKSSVEPVQRSGIWQSTRRLARRVRVDRVEVSGLSLPLREFLLAETQFFNPPETVGSCCDGVLGLDFLRLYPMEFRGSSPPEIQIWPREGFRGVEGAEWTEISELSSGELASSCSLVLSGESSPSSSDLKLEGVSWDLASEKGLQIHTPWRSQWEPILSSKKRSGTTQMVCDGRVMATKMTPSWAEAPGGPSDEGLLTEKEPAMSLGQGLLAQGRFTLDLPHGRIWFAPGTLPLREKLKNTSGLSLTYALEDRERVLRVQSVAAQSPASGLLREGLKSGTVITQVDSRPAEEMDQWEVNQRLAGVYGSQVTLQWETKKGLKLSVLRLNARGSGSASK
jgi:hypothetical protein